MNSSRTNQLHASLRTLTLGLALLFGFATPTPAATILADGYTLRIWQTDDGLPQNSISSAIQTRDGYMWIGTFGGLARFDGEKFEVFDAANTPELQDSRIVSLFEDATGALWIGHETGVISRYRAGHFESLALPPGAKRQNIRALGSDASGRIWVLHFDGTLDSPTDGAHVPTLIPQNEPTVIAWSRSARGDIWVVENGLVAQLREGKLVPLNLGAPVDSNYGEGVAAAASGGVWVATIGRIEKWNGHGGLEDHGPAPWGNETVSCCLELHDGTLAVGTVDRGLYLVYSDGRAPVHFDQTNGLPQNWIRFLYEDREANIWAGIGSAGLMAIHASAFSAVSPPDMWQGRTVLAVAPGRGGALWVGTEGAGLYHHTGERWDHFGLEEGLANPFIWSVHEDSAGEVWVGCWTGGPYRSVDGRFARYNANSSVNVPVLALLSDPHTGEVLVGNRDGLVAIRRDAATWLYRTPDGAPVNVCAVLRDREGTIWFGLGVGGLGRISAGKVSRYRRQDGLATDSVQCLFADEDDTLWIGSTAGLSRYRQGRFSTIGIKQGLASNLVCHIEDDGRGNLWLSTRRGLQRIAKEELNRCADGVIPAIASRVFDRDDGLPTVDFTDGIQAAGAKTADGRLWFTCSKGLVAVDPAHIEHNPTPPPVVLETMLVDGQNVSLEPTREANRIPPSHQRLEFRYAGLSFVAPSDVRFKYRLDGIDDDWIDAGTKRTAFYSHLPAGTYRFRVIACNNDGVWNPTGAAIDFSVAPYFWQTWWFIGSSTLLALSAVALFARHITRRRMQRRLEQLERQHAVERERARIAQDIHDDIGTSLTRIAMFSQPERNELEEPQHTAAVLRRIYTTTREATRALDEIVWAIDPRQDTLEELVGYMGRFAQEMLGGANIRCRLQLPVELPAWSVTAEIRHNLFLAFKEALNNVVKHARASEVRIALELETAAFVVVVRDDGCGFDRNIRAPGMPGRIAPGNGLPNLERRLARIGGHCEVVSEPGKGTTISFLVVVPNPSATAGGQTSAL